MIQTAARQSARSVSLNAKAAAQAACAGVGSAGDKHEGRGAQLRYYFNMNFFIESAFGVLCPLSNRALT